MTLNAEERIRTGDEPRANLRLSGATPEEVQADLDFTAARFESTLNCDDDAGPPDVWLLRDHLEQLVRDKGGSPVPYSVLTDRARLAARVWFRLRKPPRSRRRD